MAGMTISNRKVGSTTRQRRMKRRRSAVADCRSGPNIAASNVEVYPAEKNERRLASIAFRQCRAPSCRSSHSSKRTRNRPFFFYLQVFKLVRMFDIKYAIPRIIFELILARNRFGNYLIKTF